MVRTRFELLLDNPDAVVALSIVVHWRATHRAADEDLHRAARAMIGGGDLDEQRWQCILREARHLHDCLIAGADLKRYARFDALDLAVSSGVPLREEMQRQLRARLDRARSKPSTDEIRAEIDYMQGLISRAIASEHRSQGA